MVRSKKLRPSIRSKQRAVAATFRQRYDLAEARRLEVLSRLAALDDKSKTHPSYKRALTLLNDTFRKAKVAQRAAILQAAEWLVDVLELLTIIA